MQYIALPVVEPVADPRIAAGCTTVANSIGPITCQNADDSKVTQCAAGYAKVANANGKGADACQRMPWIG
jgi:hypothetical protein